MLGLGALISMDFTKYFTYFHLIFFDNMDWYLNPKTDLLINIVPEGFFRDTALRIAGMFLAGQPSVLADGRRTAAKAEIKKAEIKRIAMIKLILFGILKGIGILLLVLLLLLLLMVLVVLLSPIRYHLEGEKRAAVSGSFGVSWLFGAIRADGGYTPEGGSRLKLRVLWFTPVGGEEKPKKKKKKKKRKEPEPIEIHAAEKESKRNRNRQSQNRSLKKSSRSRNLRNRSRKSRRSRREWRKNSRKPCGA